jgi:polyisoprenoid-binding protein YceI
MRKSINIIFIILGVILVIMMPACQTAPSAAPTTLPTQEAPAKVAQPTQTEPTKSDDSSASSESTQTEDISAGTQVFMIDSDLSEARFLVDEVLRGQDVTVVGTTADISGQISTDFSDLSTTTVSQIEINPGTLVTDESRRNSAIYKFILQTDQFPKIIFTPQELIGLPDSAVVGENYTFQIAGDLTIRDIIQQVVFDVSATAVSETELSGSAVASIQRADYNLNIPSVPFVASVDETVHIEIVLVAVVQ